MEESRIRNFSIIAHIDHGKSTLADRMIELTNTVESRSMQDQVLDSMELERERGITIKMQPVRMEFPMEDTTYALNLLDTPGHIDFSYEVSRALKAVEGAILLVDATQGIQAQTLSVLDMARELGLEIVPVITKIDSSLARIDETKLEIASLLDCSIDDIVEVSGKTGKGVENLLRELVARIPEPRNLALEAAPKTGSVFTSLVFDFEYSLHRGIILYVRVFEGSVSRGDNLLFAVGGTSFVSGEVGTLVPGERPVSELSSGEIGYIVTGIKAPGIARVGETVTLTKNPSAPLAGYKTPKPVVWASVYPESEDEFEELRQALARLKLTDSSLSFEEEVSGTLGRGFRVGLLGMLHLEITVERLKREFDLSLIVTTPSITYEVEYTTGETKTIYSPTKFPDHGEIRNVREPWVQLTIIAPAEYVGELTSAFYDHEAEVGDTKTFGDGRSSIELSMPLREMMRGFFDELKSITSGYASLSYVEEGLRPAEVTRLDILIAEEVVPAFSKVIAKRRLEEEAVRTVEKIYATMPRQQFTTKIQAKALGRIVSSKTLPAYRKDVTGSLYGGDVTRKRKLLEKQKKGKKKAKERGTVTIPHDVFLKVMKET